jgi:hypothetical protein
MEIHLPKPIHGWGQFFVELATIVFGVLIALAGEQMVEAAHWRSEIKDASDAVTQELVGDDLEQAWIRHRIEACLQRQLGNMKTIVETSPTLDGLEQRVADYDPPVSSWDMDAWKTMQTSGVTLRLGAARTTAIAWAYALMPRVQEVNWREGDILWELEAQRMRHGVATQEEKDRLWSMIHRLGQLNTEIAGDSWEILDQAKQAGIGIPVARRRQLVGEQREKGGACERGRITRLVPATAPGDPRAAGRAGVRGTAGAG